MKGYRKVTKVDESLTLDTNLINSSMCRWFDRLSMTILGRWRRTISNNKVLFEGGLDSEKCIATFVHYSCYVHI